MPVILSYFQDHKSPLIFKEKYIPCWVQILDYLPLDQMMNLRRLDESFHLVVDRFLEIGEVRVDDKLMEKYPRRPYESLYSLIGSKVTKLRLSYFEDDCDVEVILNFVKKTLSKLTMFAVHLRVNKNKVKVDQLHLIHCSVEIDGNMPVWNVRLQNLLIMEHSSFFYLRIIRNVPHVRYIAGYSGWEGFNGVECELQSADITVDRLAICDYYTELMYLTRLTIDAKSLDPDMRVEMSALEYLSIKFPDHEDEWKSFVSCIGKWKCQKTLQTLILHHPPVKVQWLKRFNALRQLTIHNWRHAKEPPQYVKLKAVMPNLRVTCIPPEHREPPPKSIFEYLSDDLLIKIIGCVNTNGFHENEDDEESCALTRKRNLDNLIAADDRFKRLIEFTRCTFRGITTIGKFSSSSMHYQYQEFRSLTTKLFLGDITEVQLLAILPEFKSITYLGLTSIDLQHTGNIAGVFPKVKELYLTDS